MPVRKTHHTKPKPPEKGTPQETAAADALRQIDDLQNDSSLTPQMYTPDRVLDTAYCFYIVALMKEQHESPETEINRLAGRVVDAFHWVSEQTTPGTPEWQYMNALDQIVVSLARGIFRRKQIYESQIKAAAEMKEMQIAQMTDSTRREGFFRACVRGLLVGGFGYAVVRTLIPSLDLHEHTDPNYASVASAMAFVLLMAVVKSVIMNRRVLRIFDTFEHAQLHSNISYQQGALEEYTRAEIAACNAWERYTGEKPLNWPGFEEVLRTDLERHQKLEEQRENLQRSPFTRAISAIRTLGEKNGKTRRKPKVKANP